ncbi:MAG: NADH-quinone oxidoreductase subunit C [Nitrospirae bacterium]|nr:NADH-quinone oxidoreductase subunit C [Nitrospirota bacterium]MBF0592253.1 NADH-quinone oxidoreductase subunit C [Nitrospirota bacterium]
MNILRDAITSACSIATGRSCIGEYLRYDTNQYPASVPCCVVSREGFVESAKVMKRVYAFLVAQWATDQSQTKGCFSVFACYRKEAEYLIVTTDVPAADPTFPTLTSQYVTAWRFERQIHSLMGVTPVGHPDLRPWIKFEDWPQDAWPLRKSFEASQRMARGSGQYKWVRTEGDGTYEIPVGPVHAGIIEPGHFRFQAVGEHVINLEERLGYVHKGIEKRFESLGWHDGVRLAGRVSGDTTVAHSLAYCMALESMTQCVLPQRAHWLRALFLERERIANHLGDLGAICNDVAFAMLFYQFSRLKEMLLRTNSRLFGHRFIMDRVTLGGVAVDIDATGIREILAEMTLLEDEFERLVAIYDDNPSLEDRVRDTGYLAPEVARELGVVGIVARASGLNVDCRLHNPFPPYDRFEVIVPVLVSGDVHARAWVRVEEVRHSIVLVRRILGQLPGGDISTAIELPGANQSRSLQWLGRAGFAAVEGWRGEIIYWLASDGQGQISRCMVRDPSSVNWLALEQAIPGNIVPDFPVCNKSFNQSYSGHDL